MTDLPPNPDPLAARRPRHRVVLAFLTIVAVYSGWLGRTTRAKNPNELSRILLAASLARHGSVALTREPLEAYGVPIDISTRDGRIYSDKAPGLSLLAVPVVANPARLLPAASGPTPTATWKAPLPEYWALRHLLTWLLVVVPTAAILLHVLAASPAASPERAPPAAILVALVTPIATYATTFFGHVPAGLAAAAGFVVALTPGREAALSIRRAAAAGFLLALAATIEYPTALIGLVVLAALVLRRPGWRTLAAFIAGGAIGLLPLLVYHDHAFGAPWRTGYAFKAYRRHAEYHEVGLAGVTLPSAERLWGVLMSAKRGVLFYAPVLALVPVGLAAIGRRRRRDAWPLGLAITAYLAFAAGFVDWQGGSAAAARHLVPVLVLAVLPLAAAIEALAASRIGRPLVVVLAGTSLAGTLLSVAVTPFFPEDYDSPLAEVALRSLAEGAAGSSLLARASGTTPIVVHAVLAVLALAAVAWALVRLLPSPHARSWIPLLLVASVLAHAALLAAAAPRPTRHREEHRARLLRDLGHDALAGRIERAATSLPESPP